MRFERAIWAAHTAALPGDDLGRCILDHVVHVRDTLHDYANRLGRLADFDTPVFDELDSGPIQLVALDDTWAAVTGLVANIHRLAASIHAFPDARWYHHGVIQGRSVTALELANYAVHEAVHRLHDIERLSRPDRNATTASSHPVCESPAHRPDTASTGHKGATGHVGS